jgi:hypothetical protein
MKYAILLLLFLCSAANADSSLQRLNSLAQLPGPVTSQYGGVATIPLLSQGMVCNGMVITAVTTTASSGTVTGTGFTAAMNGQLITIPGGGTAGAVYNGTITAASTGSVTVSPVVTTAIAGTGTATTGTPDDAALQTAFTNAAAAGGATLELPTGICIISASISPTSNVSLRGQGASKSILKWISTSDMANGVIYNNGTSGNCTLAYAKANYSNINLSYFEVDGSAATMSSYVASGKGINITCGYNVTIDHVYVHDTPATCIATDFGQPSIVTNNIAENCGRLSNTSAGGNGIGHGVIGLAREAYTLTGNVVINPQHYGIILEGQNTTTTLPLAATIAGNVIIEGSNSTNSSGTWTAGIGVSGAYGGSVSGNSIFGLDTSASWAGISIDAGTQGTTDPAGTQTTVSANNVYGANVGILVNFIETNPSSGFKSNVNIHGNSVFSSYLAGIQIETNATTGGFMDGVNISGNVSCGNGSAGILFVSTANVAATNVNVSNNTLCNNGTTVATNYRQSGFGTNISITGLTFVGNTIYDNLATHKQIYGFGVASGATVSTALIQSNNFTAATSAFENLGTITGVIKDNIGWNPVGLSTVTVTASPFTYTCGNSPCQVYISGGTITTVTKSGTTLPSAAYGSIPLAPGQSVIVTYTVAPSMIVDIN